jgi:photosystem II stability/assembly factor-like uncharacterized protein
MMRRKVFTVFTLILFFLGFFFLSSSFLFPIGAKQNNQDQWYPLNNGLNGGIITCIVAHPIEKEHFFVGTTEHGVFETKDAGNSWYSISKNLENKMVLSIAIDKKDNNCLYVGTYQELFRTYDSGITWEKAETNFKKINCILINPDKVVFLGTSEGLFKSRDKQHNFQFYQVNDNDIINVAIISLAYNPLNQIVMYAGSFGKGVFISLNNGDKWNNISNSLPNQPVNNIIVDPKNGSQVFVFLEEEGVWGYTYEEATIRENTKPWLLINKLKEGERLLRIQSAIISDTTTNEFYIGTTNDGIYRFSVDKKLLKKLVIPTNIFDITCLSIKNKLLIVGTNGKGCLRSDNGGESWEVINSGLYAVKTINLLIDPFDNNKWIASSFGSVFISNDKGISWKQIFAGLPESLITCIAYQPNSNKNLLAGSEEYGLYESNDGGYNWKKNSNLNYSRITCLLIDPNNPNIVYVGSFARGMFFSKDFGRTWISLDLGTKKDQKNNPTDFITVLSVDPNDSNIVYAGTSINGIYKSLNQGKSWIHIYEVLGQDVYINDIQVSKGDSKIVYAGIKIINDGGFIKSIDQGKSWETTNLFRTGMVFKSIKVDDQDSEIVFCGTNEGVYYTKDSGYHWYNYDKGLDKEFKLYLNQFPINQMMNDPELDNKLIVTTNWGIYECQKSRKVLDRLLPEILINEPLKNPTYTNRDRLDIQGKAIDEFGIEQIIVDDKQIDFDKDTGAFKFNKDLRLGDNAIVIQALDVSYNSNQLKLKVLLDQTDPELDIISPYNYTNLTRNQVLIKGKAIDHQSGIDRVFINQNEVKVSIKEEDGYFEYNFLDLVIGKNVLEIQIFDRAGNQTKKSIELTFEVNDDIPPRIEMVNPLKDYCFTNTGRYKIEGQAIDDESGIFRVKIDNTILTLDQEKRFMFLTDLIEGKNTFVISASDYKGNETRKTFEIILDTIIPRISPINLLGESVTNTSTKNFIVRFDANDSGSGIQLIKIYFDDLLHKEIVSPKESSFQIATVLKKGLTSIKIVVLDLAGNEAKFEKNIDYNPPILIRLKIGSVDIQITRDDIMLNKTIDVAPMIYQKRTMVPLRFISEAFDAKVVWIPKPTEEAQISYQDKFIIHLWPWNPVARIEYPPEMNKAPEKITLDAPPIIKNNRTLVPLRFISDMFGAKVNWDGKKQTIEIVLAKYEN